MLKLVYAIKIGILSIGYLLGAVCLIMPDSMIRLQNVVYQKLNWKAKPIDYKKEVKNTRVMALVLLVITITVTYLFMQP